MPSSGGGWVGSPIPPVKKKNPAMRAWWLSAIIPALGRLRQEAFEFASSLGYIARSKNKNKNNRKTKNELSFSVLVQHCRHTKTCARQPIIIKEGVRPLKMSTEN
jgi:hypothetical protein